MATTVSQTKSIKECTGNLAGKRVLVRVDFNVPMDKQGQITDTTRIQLAIPTIQFLQHESAKIILVTHLGRPKGQIKDELRLAGIANTLSQLMGTEIQYVDTPIESSDTELAVQSLGNRDILILENIRFDEREEQNAPAFSKALANLADIFVLDAFGTAHRAHCSTAGIATYIPSYFGLLLDKELRFLGNVFLSNDRPIIAIIGGSKISTKLGVLENLLGKVDSLIVGGGMVFTLLKAQGIEIGTSLCEVDQLHIAKRFLDMASRSSTKLLLANDVVCTSEFSNDSPTLTVEVNAIPQNQMGLDIGPKTIEAILAEVNVAKTIIWNGPLGVFELPNFAIGTHSIASAIAQSDAISIVGGGDSVAAINQAGLSHRISHISTGGGACIELLEGKALPGITAVQKAA